MCPLPSTGTVAGHLRLRRQREDLPDLRHLRTGDVHRACPLAGRWWGAGVGLTVVVLTDDGAGGQRGGQREDGLRRSAGLDPERHAERQHPVWAGVPGGQVRMRRAGFGTFGGSDVDLLSLCLRRYQSVLSACCLRPDLALLPNADLTEVTSCPIVLSSSSG